MTPSDGASIASMTLVGVIQAIPAEQTAVIAPEENIRIVRIVRAFESFTQRTARTFRTVRTTEKT